jgi:hypothetical protein
MVHLQNSYNMLRVQGVFALREPAYRSTTHRAGRLEPFLPTNQEKNQKF